VRIIMLGMSTNIASLNVQRNLNNNTTALNKNFERLSTGLRINRAADDAAGLSVSEVLKTQIDALTQANKNAQNAVSMLQIADGAMAEMANNLGRLNELATQGSNSDLSAAQRTAISEEANALVAEIDRISNATMFNGIALLSSDATALDFQVGSDAGPNSKITVNFAEVSSATLAIDNLDFSSAEASSTSLTAVLSGINSLSASRGTLGAAATRMERAIASNDSTAENLASANGRIRDTDVGYETSQMTKNQILSQAGAALLAQANQAPKDLILKLLG
jgi:flagellin